MWTRRKVWHGNTFVELIFATSARYVKFENLENNSI